MAYVIDSSVLITIERRGSGLDELRRVLPRREAESISSISIAELLEGVSNADSLERRLQRSRYIETLIEAVPIIPFGLLAARAHAEINHALTRAGQRIGANDLLIGATAVAYGFTVLTENLRDFHRIPGLSVELPSWEDHA